MNLPTPLLALPFLLLVTAATAAEDCSALQAEVITLREKLRLLEAVAKTPVAMPLTVSAALPGTAVKPAATQTVVVEYPYSKSGCGKGLFQRAAPAQWQEADLWLDLEKGISPAAVEKLLGIEHYDLQGGANVIWQYGKCGASSSAQVLFTHGKLADWRAPAR